jgi:hypothetical protein
MSENLIWDRKPAEAEYRLEYSFNSLLAEGDTVLEARVVVKSGEIIADRFDYHDNSLFFWVRGGKPGLVGRLDMVATTTNGETLIAITRMAVD